MFRSTPKTTPNTVLEGVWSCQADETNSNMHFSVDLNWLVCFDESMGALSLQHGLESATVSWITRELFQRPRI